MRRAMTVAGLVVAAVLALSGCVGIPTSGGVQDGPIIDPQVDPEVVLLPKGPTPGSSEEEILSDFMQAVRSPQNGYAIAKKFLTTDFGAAWQPDANTLITTGPSSISEVGDSTLGYTVLSRASVDQLGRYTEQPSTSTQTLSFGFAKEEGEWRISTADNGIVLSQSSFGVAFREQALYFFDPSHHYLVPDVRWFPSRQTLPVGVVTALLAGPTDWLQQAVVSAFPTATALGDQSVQIESGTAQVDLSTEALPSSPQERDWMRQQLIATLGTANVQLTVGGRDLPTPEASGEGAIQYPSVDSAVLVGTGSAFGFDGGTGIAPLPGISDKVVAGAAVTAVLANDKQTIAFLSADGGAYVLTAGSDAPALVDDRPGLAAPTLDPFRFVWSAQAASAASLATFEVDGTPHAVQSGLPSDAQVVSMDVSRDGARILLYLSTPVGPELAVAGIIRQDNVPTALGPLLLLPVDGGTPVDATWVDNRTVAVISSSDDANSITSYEVGGPSAPLGQLAGARSITGGNGGTDGLRVLTAAGEVWRPQGSAGWVSTGIPASLLATKQ